MNKLILVPLAVLLLAGMLFAQGTMDHKPMVNPNAKIGPGPNDNPNFKPRLTDDGTGSDRMMELNLTDAQKKKLDELRVAHQKNMNSLDAEIQNLHMDVRQALKNDDFNLAKRYTQQLFDKKLAQANARLNHQEQVLKELDATQKQLFRDLHMMQGEKPWGMQHGKPGMMNKKGAHQMMQPMPGKGMMQGKGMDDCPGNDCGQMQKPGKGMMQGRCRRPNAQTWRRLRGRLPGLHLRLQGKTAKSQSETENRNFKVTPYPPPQ